MDKFREKPMEATLHRRLGRLRPDPLVLPRGEQRSPTWRPRSSTFESSSAALRST